MIYVYGGVSYKLGAGLYAMYLKDGVWKESASVTNAELIKRSES